MTCKICQTNEINLTSGICWKCLTELYYCFENPEDYERVKTYLETKITMNKSKTKLKEISFFDMKIITPNSKYPKGKYFDIRIMGAILRNNNVHSIENEKICQLVKLFKGNLWKIWGEYKLGKLSSELAEYVEKYKQLFWLGAEITSEVYNCLNRGKYKIKEHKDKTKPNQPIKEL